MDGSKKGEEKLIKTNTGREKINVNGACNPVTQEVICIEQEESVNQQSNIKLVDKIVEQSFKDRMSLTHKLQMSATDKLKSGESGTRGPPLTPSESSRLERDGLRGSLQILLNRFNWFDPNEKSTPLPDQQLAVA